MALPARNVGNRGRVPGADRRAVPRGPVTRGATIDALALDAAGQLPWWPADRGEITQHRILVHMIAETDRHAGHADITREFIDAAVGLRDRDDNVAPGDRAWWRAYRNRLERAARDTDHPSPSA